jgi:glycosyltransferase involved in cell wall biosynthesis
MRILIVDDIPLTLSERRALIDSALRLDRLERNPVMTAEYPNTEILPPEDTTAPSSLFPEAMKEPAPDAKPAPSTLALIMMVRNARQELEQTLNSVPVSLLSEVIVVDTGSTDDTVALLEAWAEQKKIPIGIMQFTPSTHPASFFKDEPQSYPVPLPEELRLQHTGEMLLCDRGAVRSLALTAANTTFGLMLDAGDELVGGPLLSEYLKVMVDNQIDVGFTMLATKMGDKLIETAPCWRLFRMKRTRSDDIFFSGPTHERLQFPKGLTRTLLLKDGLSVVNHRQAPTGSTFKVLWRHVHLQGGLESDKVEPRYLYHLGEEALLFNQGAFSKEILERYLRVADGQDGEDRARAYTTLAFMDERDGNLESAITSLESACSAVPEGQGAEEHHHLVRILHTRLNKGWDSMRGRRLLAVAADAVKLTDKAGAHGDLPNLMAGTFYAIANTALRLGQRDKAVKAIRRGLQLRPHNDHFLRLAKLARMPLRDLLPKKRS